MTDTHADFTIDHKFGSEPHRVEIKEPEKVSRPLIILIYNQYGAQSHPEMKVFHNYIEIDMKDFVSGKYRVIIQGWRPAIQ